MLGEIRNALLLQRVHHGAAAMSTLDVMKMGTENGARLLGFEKIGKIKEGWAADLAIFNVGKLEYSGSLADPLAAIIFSGYNHGVEYTIVNGKIAVEEGRLTGFDEIELMNKCNEISGRMINQF
jgi:cytosine/adenosine deaminase-related metal-dependent hydrolase